MTYQQALDYLFSQLPMYQRQGKAAFKKNLTNITKLCDVLHNPQENFKTIHVAGSNGKGSTSHLIASVLQSAGYKVGLYTSPHLIDYRERIKVNGVMIDEQSVIDFIITYKSSFDKIEPSFFEWSVGLAFLYFKELEVDIAIIETGLGGRLDSTNVINPLLSVITNISFDHQEMLGDTLEKIAFEKAGIIKERSSVVIGRLQKDIHHVFEKKAEAMHAKLHLSEPTKYSSDLTGNYQIENVATANKTIDLLIKNFRFTIPETAKVNGFNKVVKNTGLQGRWQIINYSPKAICDVGHNIDGITNIIKMLANERFDNLHFVFGMVNDKESDKILLLLPKKATYYFCKPNIPRGLETKTLKDIASNYSLFGRKYESVKHAYSEALKCASKSDLVFVGGSTFVVAEVL
jgi:dihydrofolate synthase / folylpolyglutamate synthase